MMIDWMFIMFFMIFVVEDLFDDVMIVGFIFKEVGIINLIEFVEDGE